MITVDQIKKACIGKPNIANLSQAFEGYEKFGKTFGLGLPHRDVQYFAQLMHESGDFRFDKEIWGPTAAQRKYEGRKDLGNTMKGDGAKFKGRGPIQITGRYNYKKFTAWCRWNIVGHTIPDFEDSPEKINEYPWEGLVAIWYWDSGNPDGKSLNRYADEGNNEGITKKINGGLNGYQDRLLRYRRLALVVLGYGPDDVKEFQTDAAKKGHYEKKDIDGDDGPKTRSALHRALMDLTGYEGKSAPVSEKVIETVEVKKPVVPETVKAEVKKKFNLFAWIGGLFSSGSLGLAGIAGMNWQSIVAIGGIVLVFLIAVLLFGSHLIRKINEIKQAVEE